MQLNIKKRFLDTYQSVLNDPKTIVKCVVLFICSIIMVFQVSKKKYVMLGKSKFK